MRGKFIVVYGSNNVGKTTQVSLLGKRMYDEHKAVLIIKYPIYNLLPTGPKINAILREEMKKTDLRKIQQLFAQNRKDFQKVLISILDSGISVIAEDYSGTGIAWGLTFDLDLDYFENINKGLLEPDIAILLNGKRFIEAKEKNHIYEDSGNDIWIKNKKAHLFLAKRYKWLVINSGKSIEEVHNNIWKHVSKKVNKKAPRKAHKDK